MLQSFPSPLPFPTPRIEPRISHLFLLGLTACCSAIHFTPMLARTNCSYRAFFFALYDVLLLKGNPLVLWSNLWCLLIMALSPANMTQYSAMEKKRPLPRQLSRSRLLGPGVSHVAVEAGGGVVEGRDREDGAGVGGDAFFGSCWKRSPSLSVWCVWWSGIWDRHRIDRGGLPSTEDPSGTAPESKTTIRPSASREKPNERAKYVSRADFDCQSGQRATTVGGNRV